MKAARRVECRWTVNKDEFELAYRRYMDRGGHSYDAWDIAAAWRDYQNGTDSFDWLNGE